MAVRRLPSQDVLNQLLRYDPETGKLFWRERPSSFFSDGYRTAEGKAANWNSRFAGQEAFVTPHVHGHLSGVLNYRRYLAHRIIWKMMTGEEPDTVDHENGIGSDNRWINLRSVTQQENTQNSGLSKNNTSGVNGVCWDKRRGKWYARIKVDRRNIFLGTFDTLQEAEAARLQANHDYGFHETHGQKRAQ